jgi:hypothetical protein
LSLASTIANTPSMICSGPGRASLLLLLQH